MFLDTCWDVVEALSQKIFNVLGCIGIQTSDLNRVVEGIIHTWDGFTRRFRRQISCWVQSSSYTNQTSLKHPKTNLCFPPEKWCFRDYRKRSSSFPQINKKETTGRGVEFSSDKKKETTGKEFEFSSDKKNKSCFFFSWV